MVPPSRPVAAPAPGPAFDSPELARAVEGVVLRPGRLPIRGGAVDSRRVEPGNLFVALPGERTDGHTFLDEAVLRGAAALLVSRPLPAADLDRLARDGAVTVIRVADGLRALQAAAAAWRGRFSPLVVGITGSLAKTSTKEAAAAVLGQRLRTLASAGNENNEIGLPLTLLRLAPQHQAAVLEMGMYVEGDISLLAGLARPRIGVVTAVRGVHLSRAGSLAAIEREKGRLVEALPADGVAVLNADDPRVRRMARRTSARILTYGFAASADVGADEVEPAGAAGMRCVLRLPDRRTPVAIPALGRHGLHNALAAAAVGVAAGLDEEAIRAGLEAGWSAPHRSVLVRAGEWLIVDDSYNAAPDSMAAALDLLAGLPGRHVAVLGEMRELGRAGPSEHRRLGQRAAGVADVLVTVGRSAARAAEAALEAGLPAEAVHHLPDAEAVVQRLPRLLRPGDTVLVKGSRAVALEAVVEALIAAGREGDKR